MGSTRSIVPARRRYVGRILRRQTGRLPVQTPVKFGAVNLLAAKALGVDVPQTLLAVADEVIE